MKAPGVLLPVALAVALALTLTLVATPADAQGAGPDEASGAPPRSHFFGWIDGGYGAHSLYGVGGGGVDVSAGLGRPQGGTWDFGAVLDGVRGKTSSGLDVTDVTAGVLASWHLGARFRLGGGLRLGIYDVHRATAAGDLTSLSAGAFARLTFDLVPFEDGSQRAVYLLARGSVDSVGPLAVLSIIPLLQGGVGLGLRF